MTTLDTALKVGEAVMSAPTIPMTDEQSRLFISCVIGSNEKLAPEITSLFQWQVFDKRLEAHGVTVDQELRIFILFGLCKSVGEVILWAAVMHAMQCKNLPRTMEGLADVFVLGFPTNETLGAIWDQQKNTDRSENRQGSDNWLDYPEAWNV